MSNSFTVEGRLGSDPESFSAGAKFSVAENIYGQEAPQWHRIVAFKQLGEFVSKYLKKGSHVWVSGEIRYGSYENKDGNTVYTTDVIAKTINFINSAKKDSSGMSNKEFEEKHNLPPAGSLAKPNPDAGYDVVDVSDEELPF